MLPQRFVTSPENFIVGIFVGALVACTIIGLVSLFL